MRAFILLRMFLSLILFFALTACSGSGDLASGGGIGGTGVISSGEITAIGSVWVNDVEFDTTTAELYVDDDLVGTGDQSIVDNLGPGQIVRVEGILNDDESGTAERVFYSSTLTGPIDQIIRQDQNTMTLQVLGQTLMIDENTSLKGANKEELSIGNLVEISGFIDAEKRIQCSFLYKKEDVVQHGAILRISGMVEEMNEIAHTFFINDMEINYEQAEIYGFLNGGLENGAYVSVTGKMSNGLDGFKADKVEPFERLGENNAEKIIIEGIVNKKMAANRFIIEGYTLEVTSGTKYNGGTSSDVSAGAHIEVTGEFSEGIIVCEKVNFGRKFKMQ